MSLESLWPGHAPSHKCLCLGLMQRHHRCECTVGLLCVTFYPSVWRIKKSYFIRGGCSALSCCNRASGNAFSLQQQTASFPQRKRVLARSTLVYAWLAPMHRFLSVHLSVTGNKNLVVLLSMTQITSYFSKLGFSLSLTSPGGIFIDHESKGDNTFASVRPPIRLFV